MFSRSERISAISYSSSTMRMLESIDSSGMTVLLLLFEGENNTKLLRSKFPSG
jgi:hypothetical protein